MKSFIPEEFWKFSQFSISVSLSVVILIVSCKKELPKGNIEGYIFFAQTNIPISDVAVNIAGKSSVTNIEGYFHLDGITIGDYSLTATKNGFHPFSIPVTITSEPTEPLAIPMISPVFTARIYGIITSDLTGTPQKDLTVKLQFSAGPENILMYLTGPDGYYEIHMVPFGEWFMTVTGSGGIVYEETLFIQNNEYPHDIQVAEPMLARDSRDGKEYLTTKIGAQVWMAENLAYLPIVSPPGETSDSLEMYYVYGYEGNVIEDAKQTTNYAKYGVLYNWEAAVNACPEGFHLPSDSEWQTLESHLGMDPEETNSPKWRMSGGVGAKLKSLEGWFEGGNGNNLSGFNALPGGSRNVNGSFGAIGVRANFWSGTTNNETFSWYRSLISDEGGVYRFFFQKSLGFSVRCISDD